jgi:uncharacterized protein (DUF1697 family)
VKPSSYIGLLRAVNVGGRNQIAMADLRDLMADLKLGNPRTLLQSGNVVFETDSRRAAELESLLETELQRRLNIAADIVLRSAEEWRELIARNPFKEEAKGDPGRLIVMVLKEAPAPRLVKDLQAGIAGPEIVRGGEKHLYIVYPEGVGRSRLTNANIERTLGTRGTGRNWNTVLKLGALT